MSHLKPIHNCVITIGLYLKFPFFFQNVKESLKPREHKIYEQIIWLLIKIKLNALLVDGSCDPPYAFIYISIICIVSLPNKNLKISVVFGLQKFFHDFRVFKEIFEG